MGRPAWRSTGLRSRGRGRNIHPYPFTTCDDLRRLLLVIETGQPESGSESLVSRILAAPLQLFFISFSERFSKTLYRYAILLSHSNTISVSNFLSATQVPPSSLRLRLLSSLQLTTLTYNSSWRCWNWFMEYCHLKSCLVSNSYELFRSVPLPAMILVAVSLFSNLLSCTIGEESLRSKYKQDTKLGFVIKATYAMAWALHNMQQSVCGVPSAGLCPDMLPINGSLLRVITLFIPYKLWLTMTSIETWVFIVLFCISYLLLHLHGFILLSIVLCVLKKNNLKVRWRNVCIFNRLLFRENAEWICMDFVNVTVTVTGSFFVVICAFVTKCQRASWEAYSIWLSDHYDVVNVVYPRLIFISRASWRWLFCARLTRNSFNTSPKVPPIGYTLHSNIYRPGSGTNELFMLTTKTIIRCIKPALMAHNSSMIWFIPRRNFIHINDKE